LRDTVGSFCFLALDLQYLSWSDCRFLKLFGRLL